jgi:hypothetical protein
MTAISKPPHTARARSTWITRYSSAYHDEVHGPRYLIGFALLAILFLIILLAIAVGSAAAEMFGIYTSWLKSLALPQ